MRHATSAPAWPQVCIGTQVYRRIWLWCCTILKLLEIEKLPPNHWMRKAREEDGYPSLFPMDQRCSIPASDILLAYVLVNGEALLPDHGCPLWLVEPPDCYWVACGLHPSYSLSWCHQHPCHITDEASAARASHSLAWKKIPSNWGGCTVSLQTVHTILGSVNMNS